MCKNQVLKNACAVCRDSNVSCLIDERLLETSVMIREWYCAAHFQTVNVPLQSLLQSVKLFGCHSCVDHNCVETDASVLTAVIHGTSHNFASCARTTTIIGLRICAVQVA